MIFNFDIMKCRGHKWLIAKCEGLRADICIDDWFSYAHSCDISCVTVPGWLSISGFCYSFDSVGNLVLDIPTCYGYHSARGGRLRSTGNFHSHVVLRPHYLEYVKSYFF